MIDEHIKPQFYILQNFYQIAKQGWCEKNYAVMPFWIKEAIFTVLLIWSRPEGTVILFFFF